MKRIIPGILALCLLLAACSSTPAVSTEPTDTIPTQSTEPPEPIQQLDMSAVSLPAVVETLSSDGEIIFTFTGQSMDLVVPDPDVAEKIIIDFGQRQAQFHSAAETIHQLAAEMYTGEEWNPYIYSVLYDPMRIDENVLSLAGTVVSWSGGNHPNYNCVYANYNMITGDVMTLGSILTHKDKAADLSQLLIAAIGEIQEEKYIWEDYADIIEDRFAADISYDDAWYFDANGLCFRFSVYEIAPYSSGIISVTIPYDKLTGIIEDAYFPIEKQQIAGSISAAPMAQFNADEFSQGAELVLDPEGTRILLSTDSILYDVCIKQVIHPNYIACRTMSLSPGDAIMLQADFENTQLLVEYTADGVVTKQLIQVSGDEVTLISE